MRRGPLSLICGLVALAAPGSAQAQSFLAVFGMGKQISDTVLPAGVSGELGVRFHADPASGCAALAACGYRGAITWNPGGGGTLEVDKYRQRRRVHVLAILSLGAHQPGNGSLTAAIVHRFTGRVRVATCADEVAASSYIEAAQHGAEVTFTLVDELSATRCAGPLPSDLTAVSPTATVATSALARGNLRLDFRTQRSFAGHGFAGTLTSTVVVTVGRPQGQNAGPGSPLSLPTERLRIVTEPLRLTELAGSLTASVTGTRNADVCVLLDSCGLVGTLNITPKVSALQGELTAIGPASRPYRDFLTALGLTRTGRRRGIEVGGELDWADTGTVSAALHQTAACSDSAPVGAGDVELTVGGRRVRFTYTAGGGALFGTGETMRTRCPGPMLLQANPLAFGSIARSQLAKRAFTVRLVGGGNAEDQGYDTSLAGALTLRLRRGRPRQSIVTGP